MPRVYGVVPLRSMVRPAPRGTRPGAAPALVELGSMCRGVYLGRARVQRVCQMARDVPRPRCATVETCRCPRCATADRCHGPTYVTAKACQDRVVPWSSRPKSRCATGEVCHGQGVPRARRATGEVCHGRGVPRARCATVEVCHGRGVPRSRCAMVEVCHGPTCVMRCAMPRPRGAMVGGVPWSEWCHGRGVPWS